jgi:hypothetical protein
MPKELMVPIKTFKNVLPKELMKAIETYNKSYSSQTDKVIQIFNWRWIHNSKTKPYHAQMIIIEAVINVCQNNLWYQLRHSKCFDDTNGDIQINITKYLFMTTRTKLLYLLLLVIFMLIRMNKIIPCCKTYH